MKDDGTGELGHRWCFELASSKAAKVVIMVHAMGLEVYSVFAWLRRGRMGCDMVSDTSFRAVHETDWSTEGRGWTEKNER